MPRSGQGHCTPGATVIPGHRATVPTGPLWVLGHSGHRNTGTTGPQRVRWDCGAGSTGALYPSLRLQQAGAGLGQRWPARLSRNPAEVLKIKNRSRKFDPLFCHLQEDFKS